MNKSSYLLELNNIATNYHLIEAEKRRETLKIENNEKINKKKLFDKKIKDLVKIYYPLVINELEEKSKNGKKLGVLNIEKSDFEIIYVNNGYKRNLDIMMKELLYKYNEKLRGLKYQILLNNIGELLLKLYW